MTGEPSKEHTIWRVFGYYELWAPNHRPNRDPAYNPYDPNAVQVFEGNCDQATEEYNRLTLKPAVIKHQTCKANLWDNGDQISCGKSVVRGGYCETCLPFFHKQISDVFKADLKNLSEDLRHILEMDDPLLRGSTLSVVELMFNEIIATHRKTFLG